MKKKRILIIAGIIVLAAGIFFIAERIKSLQQTPFKIVDETPQMSAASYRTTEVCDFSTILELAGVQGCEGIAMDSDKNDAFGGDARFESETYGYENTEMCALFLDIMNAYRYTYCRKPVLEIRAKSYAAIKLYDRNGKGLMVAISETEEEGMVGVEFAVIDKAWNVLDTSLDKKYFNGFLADAEIVDELYEMFAKYTKRATLDEVKAIIENSDDVLSWKKILYFEHDKTKDYNNYETGESYFVTEMKLTDYDGLLKVYYLNHCIDNDIYDCILKIELYDNRNQLSETLYVNEAWEYICVIRSHA